MAFAADIPTSREAIVEQLFDLFRRSGFEGVSISGISAVTGLGKSSLYHHFPGGKEDMAHAVLEHANECLRTEVLSALGEAGAPRGRRIDRMLSALNGLYCGGTKPCVLASMLLGKADAGVGHAVSDTFGRWRDCLVKALVETGAKRSRAKESAALAIAQLEGAVILSQALNDSDIFKRSQTFAGKLQKEA